jgi:hypothetical protein
MLVIKWIIVACACVVFGWFVFDGSRALVVGDYVTPKTGEHAGQLGPWSKVVAAVGIEPRSTAMKMIFLLLGICGLAVAVCLLLQLSWAWWAMLIMAILSLWYAPFGTLLGVIEMILLVVLRLKF